MGLDGSLAAEQRRQALLRSLEESGRVDLLAVAGDLGVHPMTIRRDLKQLEREGSARLVRGGAIAVGAEEFAIRQSKALSAKRTIARKLAPLLAGHASVGIDASTTLFRFVEEELPDRADLLLVTYGIPAFQAVQHRPGVRAFLSGGELNGRSGSLVGPVAQRSVASFALSCCFLSTSGLDHQGTTEPTVEEVEMKRAMLEASQQVVLAVDTTKLGQRSAVRSFGLDRVDILVTELDPADERLDEHRDAVRLV